MQVIYEILRTVSKIENEYAQALTLIDLIPQLDIELKEHVVQEALVCSHKIKDIRGRARALAKLASQLTDEIQAQCIQDALTAAREIGRENQFEGLGIVPVFGDLPTILDDKFRIQAFGIALEIMDEHVRSQALSAIASQLSGELKVQALAAAHEIRQTNKRVSVLSNLARHFNVELKIKILQEILYQSDNDLLDGVLDVWKEIGFTGLKENIFLFIKSQSQNNRNFGIAVLGSLIPALVHFRGPEIVPELYRAIQDTAHWWP